MKIWDRIFKYGDIIAGVITAYVIIKIVDNYDFFFSIVTSITRIVSPFIYAFIIAYILNPIMKLFERKLKLKRWISIVLTYAVIVGVFVIMLTNLIPSMASSIMDIAKNVPQYAIKIQDDVNQILSRNDMQEFLNSTNYFDSIDINMITTKGSEILVRALNSIAENMVSFTSSLIKWAFGFIISIYVLADKEKFVNFFHNITYLIFKDKWGRRISTFISSLNNMIGVYVGIKAIDSLIIGVMAFIGMTVLRIPYAILLAVIVGITNMIPYFGPFVGMLVAFTINIFINPIKAAAVLIFLFILQQFDGWYLDPKLIGGKVGLHPFLVILAVTIGGGFYGPVGMILSVPIMAVIKEYANKIMKYNINLKKNI